MSDDTYYTVLGVSETATELEIKTAYRNLVKKIHPDTVSTLSQELRFLAEGATKEITEAYSVLSDQSKRRQYDLELVAHRHTSVLTSTIPNVPTYPRVRSRTSPAASNSRRRRHVHHSENNNQYSRSRIGRWVLRHPGLAGLLFVIGICIVVLMLFFSFACGGTSVCRTLSGSTSGGSEGR